MKNKHYESVYFAIMFDEFVSLKKSRKMFLLMKEDEYYYSCNTKIANEMQLHIYPRFIRNLYRIKLLEDSEKNK